MNQPILLIIVQCLFFHVKAQDTSSPDPGASVLHPLHPNLAVIIAILSVMLSATFLLLAYAKFCRATIVPTIILNRNNPDQDFDELVQPRSRFSGIDRTAIESLPFFRFSSLKGSKEGLECAVCISKFEDTETLRLLPKCRHAFHMNCIDQWLESHSSCPLCRYKIDVKDRKSFTYSNSLRFLQNPSNLTEDPNVELFVRREQDHQGSSILKTGSGSPNIDQGRNEGQLLIQECDGDPKILHKFKHKIIVSDVVIKNRWSEVNSADLLFLNSQMLGVTSRSRLAPLKPISERFQNALFMNEDIDKIKEDIERKRLFESKFSRIDGNLPISSPSFPNPSSKMLNPAEKRSMSEITNLSRFRQFSVRNKMKETAAGGNNGEEERIRRLWLPIAQRTIQWFAGRDINVQESQNQQETLPV